MRLIAIVGVLAATAGPCLADATWTAMPAQPSSRTGIVANSVAWDCNAGGCYSTTPTSGADPLSTCMALAHEVGELSSFSIDGKPMAAGHLVHCNASAAKPGH